MSNVTLRTGHAETCNVNHQEFVRCKNRRLLAIALFAIVASFLCLMMCSCAVRQSQASRTSAASESVYSFPEAGFEAKFPDKPEKAMAKGMYQETEPSYVAFKNNTMTNVSIAQAPEGFGAEAISSPDSEETLKADLYMQLYTYQSGLNIQDVNLDSDIEYFDLDVTSPFSLWAYFDGYLDLSKGGGSSREYKHFCCGFVYGNDWIYSVFVIRDTQEDAKTAARSFKLIDVSTSSGGSAQNDSSNAIPQGAISWQEASRHIGETVTIYGPVVETEYSSSSNSQPTFIDIGAAYPDESRVTAVVWGEDRSAFPQAPETMYEGKSICVTGELYVYNGACNIKVTSPNQISIL